MRDTAFLVKTAPMTSHMLSAVDLFAGCGGLTEGLWRAGFRVRGAIEVEPRIANTYQLNHPEVAILPEDISCVSTRRLLRRLSLTVGELDLLAGCPPCQGFSSLRTLNGYRQTKDHRNDLVFQFLRLIRGTRPKTVMLENVPGLANDARFSKLIDAMIEDGYTVNWDVLDAADYAVPQRRKRLILVASRFGQVPFAPRARKRISVADAIGALPTAGKSGDALHDIPEQRQPRIQRLIESIPKNGGSRTDLPKNRQLMCHRRCNGFKDVYGRMCWNDVAPTITTGCYNPSKGRFLHPDENRNITMREAALLQTFPRGYRFPPELAKHEIASMIGNALPPEFIRRHARQIRRHLERNGVLSSARRKRS